MLQLTVLIAVKDTAARFFNQPVFVPTPAVAQRSFSEAINDPQNDFYKHYTDFELYEIGAFDASTGLLTPLPEPRLIVRGKDVRLSSFDGDTGHTDNTYTMTTRYPGKTVTEVKSKS